MVLSHLKVAAFVAAALVLYGCPDGDAVADAVPDSALNDAMTMVSDAGGGDSAVEVSDPSDGAPDAATPDPATPDAATPDAATPDAATTDAAASDAAASDAAIPDGGGMNSPEVPVIPESVLFVGNSFTFWMDGLDTHLPALRASSDNMEPFAADSVVRGGASLEVMWARTNARRRIANGGFDVVVLQEDIPETDVESFFTYARLFVEAVRAAGARPVLFMAWNYERLGWISMAEIAEAHDTIAAELEVEVAPAGLAWQRAATARPALSMYDDDDEHPSIHGVYLNACVVYARLFGESPVGLGYRPDQEGGISDMDALFLQNIAWETVAGE